ncbi:MAG TPA: hypothetical protein VN688_03060 [Gemmataceae bacterium]|nr:hypothetical protein [Gemmataceae bacterium]
MHLEAFPMQFVALTDGVLDGQEHIILFLEHADRGQPRGLALNLGDARALLTALRNILPEAQQIQNRLHEQN